MKQINCEKIRLLWLYIVLLLPFARIHCNRIKTTNQSQGERLMECQSLLVHTADPLPRACSHSVKLRIFSVRLQELCERNGEQTTTSENEKKQPIPPLPTTAHMTKTSKQKTTNEEKQAKKKESDRGQDAWQPRLQGGALEAGLERWWRGRGRDLEVVLVHIFKSPLFSILLTSALTKYFEFSTKDEKSCSKLWSR